MPLAWCTIQFAATCGANYPPQYELTLATFSSQMYSGKGTEVALGWWNLGQNLSTSNTLGGKTNLAPSRLPKAYTFGVCVIHGTKSTPGYIKELNATSRPLNSPSTNI
jgi:hypothetical protein